MFLWPVALIGLMLAAVTRRPLSFLLVRRFRWIGLLLMGLGLQLLMVLAASGPFLSTPTLPGFPQAGGVLYITSLGLLLVFAWLNRRGLGIAVMGVGLLMNAVVIAANGGQMPVDPGQMAAQGSLDKMVAEETAGTWTAHAQIGPATRLAFLGDSVLLRAPQPLTRSVIVSPGDLVIAAGILLFLMVIPEAKAASSKSAGGLASP